MFKALGGIVALLIVGTLLWIGGELHYRNCVNTAKAIPDTRNQAQRDIDRSGGTDPHAAKVTKRIEGCSRLPF